MLPIECLFSGVALHYKTVFGYFRTWCKSELWQRIWSRLLDTYMSSVDLDGSHTPALRGGEQVVYQGRKKKNYQCTVSYRQAWIDNFRTLLNRFDVTCSSWCSFNFIAFIVILLKKINKNKKSR